MTGRHVHNQLCRVRKRHLHFFMILWPDLPFLPSFFPHPFLFFSLFPLLVSSFIPLIPSFHNILPFFFFSLFSFLNCSYSFILISNPPFFPFSHFSTSFLVSQLPSILLSLVSFPLFLPFSERQSRVSVWFQTVQIISLSGKFQTCKMQNQIHPFISRLSRTTGNNLEIKYIWNFWCD